MPGTATGTANGAARVLTVRHEGWATPERTAPLPAPGEGGLGLHVTDRGLFRHGTGFVPVSGELHYSRVPRERWGERLRRMRAGGVTVVATYVFWLHHVAERGHPRFDGDLDVAAFLDEAAAAGLDVALRIGPWAHGEARHGGFPDWVQAAPVAHRTDDPGYLALVREWFGQLAGALGGRVRPGGPVIAVQLENELYDRPEHLSTLRTLAREAGITAPLWTATAWGGADLPHGVVFPLYGGYADGFWNDPGAGWDPSFRAHFFFSHEWDDPGVGADVRAAQGFDAAASVSAGSVPEAARASFPPATCELGGGMATAYHRRPVPSGRDIATVAHLKIGNGSAWQGYYMYAGGRNPGPGLHESIDTGYPNDITPLGYDFHAPLGQAGDAGPAYGMLREQHAFLAAFGDRLTAMTSSLPEVLPAGLDDTDTLRWALRSDGQSGFVFVSRHQPHLPLADARDVRLRVELDDEAIDIEPVDIPAGTLARWPVSLPIGGVRLRWATASALTVLPGGAPGRDLDGPSGGVPTLVLVADPGIAPRLAVGAEVHDLRPGEVLHLRTADGAADVLLVAAGTPVWVHEHAGARSLLRGDPDAPDDELLWDDGVPWHEGLRVRSPSEAVALERWDTDAAAWRPVALAPRGLPAAGADVTTVPLRAAGTVPADYGFGGARHRAPGRERFDELAAVWRLDLPDWSRQPAHDALLEVRAGFDVGELRIDGVPVDDRYADGEPWRISLRDALRDAATDAVVTLHLLPLSAASTVDLPVAYSARRDGGEAQVLEIDALTVHSRGPWRPASDPEGPRP